MRAEVLQGLRLARTGAVEVDDVQRAGARHEPGLRAASAGSSRYTVSFSKRPWTRRTARPPWMSIAG